MPSHEVLLNLHTKVISHKDVELEVRSDSAKLGTLLISKGNIEWLPANNSVNKYRMSWEAFSDAMIQYGRNVKF